MPAAQLLSTILQSLVTIPASVRIRGGDVAPPTSRARHIHDAIHQVAHIDLASPPPPCAAPPILPLAPPSSKKHREPKSRQETWRRCVRRATCSRGMAPWRNMTCPAVEKRFRYSRPFRDRSGRGRAETRSARLTPEPIGGHSHAQSHLCDARACVPRRHMGFGRELFSLQQRWVPVKAAGRRISPSPRDPPANRSPRTRRSESIRISVVTTSRIFVFGLGGAPTRIAFSRRRPRPPAIVGARAAKDRIGHARHPLGLCGRVGALAGRAPPPRLPAGGAGACARRLKRTVPAFCGPSSICRPPSTDPSKRTIGVPRSPRGPPASTGSSPPSGAGCKCQIRSAGTAYRRCSQKQGLNINGVYITII